MNTSNDLSRFLEEYKAFSQSLAEEKFIHYKHKFHVLLRDHKLLYNSRNENNRTRASHYNLFNILSIKEEKKHTSFLRNLLDPQGTHGQSDLFLSSFIEKFVPKYKKDSFNLADKNDYCIKEEKQICIIGKFVPESKKDSFNLADKNDYCIKEEKRILNGILDIYISSIDLEKPFTIIIENKWGAQDQKGQLQKYYEYIKSRKLNDSQGIIFYLTLHGDDPGGESSCFKKSIPELQKENVLCKLSYENDIKDWLSDLIKTIASPKVRCSVEQYIEKINIDNVRGVAMMSPYEEKMFDCLTREDNFLLATDIVRIFPDLRKNLIKQFWEEIMKKKLNEKIKNKWEIKIRGNIGTDPSSDYFLSIQLSQYPYVFVGFDSLSEKLRYGLWIYPHGYPPDNDKKDVLDREKIKTHVSEKIEEPWNHVDENNLFYSKETDYDFENDHTLKKILPENRDGLAEKFCDIILEFAEKLEKDALEISKMTKISRIFADLREKLIKQFWEIIKEKLNEKIKNKWKIKIEGDIHEKEPSDYFLAIELNQYVFVGFDSLSEKLRYGLWIYPHGYPPTGDKKDDVLDREKIKTHVSKIEELWNDMNENDFFYSYSKETDYDFENDHTLKKILPENRDGLAEKFCDIILEFAEKLEKDALEISKMTKK